MIYLGEGGLGVFIAPTEGITVDVQAAEVLYRNAEIKPVPDSMSAFADFETVFGKEALQCAWRFHHKHRKWVEIIGENHELLVRQQCIDDLPIVLYPIVCVCLGLVSHT